MAGKMKNKTTRKRIHFLGSIRCDHICTPADNEDCCIPLDNDTKNVFQHIDTTFVAQAHQKDEFAETCDVDGNVVMLDLRVGISRLPQKIVNIKHRE